MPRSGPADVVVVGFGPTGAMAALRCAQRGLSVIAIDASTEIYPLPRAMSLDAEGSRLFHTAGLADQLTACSTPLRGAEFVDADRNRVVGFDLPDGFVGPLGHPPGRMFDQPLLEAALRAAAVEAGVDVRLGVSAQALESNDGGVRIETSGGPVEARWMIGADGASSWARKQLDVTLTDQGYDQPWLVVDTTLRVDRTAVYRFHALVADRFRIGPVFLAGDAAHQMPPFNGQGMCSGLRDADNLAWKLALVAHGIANDDLLDSYDAERRPHAIATVEHTCDAGRLIDAIAAGVDLATEAGYGGGRPAPYLDRGLVSGSHPAVGRPCPQPRVGGQLLDELLGDGFAVVSASPVALPSVLSQLGARSVVVPEDAFPPGLLDANHAVIVRPDRIVAAVCDDLEATAERLFSQFLS